MIFNSSLILKVNTVNVILSKIPKICKLIFISTEKNDPMKCVPMSPIFKQYIHTISTSLTCLSRFPNVLQFYQVSSNSFIVLEMLSFLDQILHLFSYLVHGYCGWKKKQQAENIEVFTCVFKFTLSRWVD